MFFFFVPRKLKEEAATEVCPPSAETLKNGITSHTLLVILHCSHTYTYKTNAVCMSVLELVLQYKIVECNMQI